MKAAIDIGTNTVLLLVAEVVRDKLNVIEEQQRIPRLGRGVDKEQNLAQESMDRVIKALKEYKTFLDKEYPSIEEPIVTATSAVRDAQNRQEFLSRVREETGFQIELLSGFEEAQYTFLGAQSVLATDGGREQTTAVLDIGGGSTELAIGEGSHISDRHSFDMGCVRFTERFLDTPSISQYQIEHCKDAVVKMLSEYSLDFSSQPTLIGVAGTVTSLAVMDQELEKYDPNRINGYKLSAETIANHIKMVRNISSDQLIRRYPTVMKGRADIFLAGLLVLEEIMNHYGFSSLTVSTGGIRHGALILS